MYTSVYTFYTRGKYVDMQVFLPYANVAQSFQALDMRRLNKQHLELHQLMVCVNKKRRGEPTSHHAAVNLFVDHPTFLAYCFVLCVEICLERGVHINAYYNEYKELEQKFQQPQRIDKPQWYFHEKFHLAHRQALLAKSYARLITSGNKSRVEQKAARDEYNWYRSFGWVEQVQTSRYHYYWWNAEKHVLYQGAVRDALEE